MPVLKYVLTKYIEMKIHFDQIWLIMPCSPLITKNDFINAEKIYYAQKNKFKLMSKYQNIPLPLSGHIKK